MKIYNKGDKFMGMNIVLHNGYPVIRQFINGKSKYKRIHRIIMEKYLGRKLKIDEIVHHKDQNKLNADINNLEITTQSKHASKHKRQSKIDQYQFIAKRFRNEKNECTISSGTSINEENLNNKIMRLENE